MNLEILALASMVLAAIPCALFLINLCGYRPPEERDLRKNRLSDVAARQRAARFTEAKLRGISVLIPARNEEQNIRATVAAVLANRVNNLEVIVLDDHSTDSTSSIVIEIAREDHRVRLEFAPALPAGWCGKQHACHVLGALARYPMLLFIDADVRLAPFALTQLVGFMEQSDASLASGVPRQELETFSERLLIPLIHFVLLGFLPMRAMRRSKLPALSAGCGQLFIARSEAYKQCGGHAKLRDSLHDGLKLPRVFRQAGFATDLLDATDLAACRMYRTNAETWRGLGKNAVEGLAAPATIGPMTALLFGGQVLPFILLARAADLTMSGLRMAVLGAIFAYLPRLVGCGSFRQPLLSALLHPIGVIALLGIQWHAFLRYLAGKPSAWKGRSYLSPASPTPAQT
jgi:hypothetical protein